jgi:hypothetical protein
MQFHQGYALAQTVFTCGYIHQLEQLDLEDAFLRRIEDNTYPVELMTVVLRSFLRGGLKTCDILMEELIKGHTYDVSDDAADICVQDDLIVDSSRTKTLYQIRVECPCWKMSRSIRYWKNSIKLQTS